MRFDSYHPAINLLFFSAVFVGAAYFRHPVFVLISLCCAVGWCIVLYGRRGIGRSAAALIAGLAYSGWYSVYHHFGMTVLGYNRIGNPITLESILYGLLLGAVLAAILLWIGCLNAVFTADKIIFLLGRVWPKLSLFLAILLRLLPRTAAEYRRIKSARAGIGRGVRQGNIFRRIRNWISALSITLTWLTESLVTTSDSMRARGYTLRGRTAYSIYRFENRDRIVLVLLCAAIAVSVSGAALGQSFFLWDPRIVTVAVTPLSYVFYLGYALLCALPMLLQLGSTLRFQHARRQII